MLNDLDALDKFVERKSHRIGVIGAGRLGICFALLVDAAGYNVVVSDVRESYVKNLNERTISTNEPLVADLLKDSKIKATTSNKEVIEECAAFPYGDNDDLVDSTTQAVMRFRQGGFIMHPEDEKDGKNIRTTHPEYY